MQRSDFLVIFCVFWLSLLRYVDYFIYFMLLLSFKSICQKRFNEKNYLEKNLKVRSVYFCYGHASLKRETIFNLIAIFCHYSNYNHVFKNKVKGNIGI